MVRESPKSACKQIFRLLSRFSNTNVTTVQRAAAISNAEGDVKQDTRRAFTDDEEEKMARALRAAPTAQTMTIKEVATWLSDFCAREFQRQVFFVVSDRF